MTRRRLPKDWQALLDAAVGADCAVVEKRKGLLIRHPDGGTAMFHHSPQASGRSFANARGDLRRIGVDV